MAATEYRYSDVVIEADVGRRLFGIVINYDDIALIEGQFREKIERGALKIADVVLNFQHDKKRPLARLGKNLELKESKTALEMRANLPKTRDADDTLELVKRGILKGLSVEMEVIKDEWKNGGRFRKITEAVLTGIGVVSKPAYGDSSVEARAIEMRNDAIENGRVKELDGGLYRTELRAKFNRLRGFIPYNEEAIVSMRYGEKQIIRPDAFTNIGDKDADIFLLAGYDYGKALASTGAGSLVIENKPDGIEFRMTKSMPKTQHSKDTMAMMKAGLIQGVVPGFVPVDESLENGIKIIKQGMLCEINLVGRGTAGGTIGNTRRSLRRWAM